MFPSHDHKGYEITVPDGSTWFVVLPTISAYTKADNKLADITGGSGLVGWVMTF